MTDWTKQIMERLEALGRISEEPGRLTRTFGSSAARRANELAGRWMKQAGMSVRQDLVGNLIGYYEPASGAQDCSPEEIAGNGRAKPEPRPPTLVIGSHLDTVRNAGKFDGILGVLLGIACVARLKQEKIRLPFTIQVVAFADEEGVRFQSAYLGSRAAAGRLERAELERKDAQGISVAEAILRAKNLGAPFLKDGRRSWSSALREARFDGRRLAGYLEAHIEQGPVLEQRKLAVGVVTAIAGQSRLRICFSGKAGHAGACPMALRRDALCGAAELVLAVENLGRRTAGLVATVGYLQPAPNTSNVIPGAANLSVDVRHQGDAARRRAEARVRSLARSIAKARRLAVTVESVQQEPAVPCSRRLSSLLTRAVKRYQPEAADLPSGAGHDAVMMAALTPVAMLFIRCKDGLSHHPDESVKPADIRVALDVMCEFIHLLSKERKT
jgi:allantoate deiminase